SGANTRPLNAPTPSVEKYVPVTYSAPKALAPSAAPCLLTLNRLPAWNAVMSSNSGAAVLSRSYNGNEKNPQRPWRPTAIGSSPPTGYGGAGSEAGSWGSMGASMGVKTGAVPPIPTASVSTAAVVNTRDARNCLAASRIEAIRRRTGRSLPDGAWRALHATD